MSTIETELTDAHHAALELAAETKAAFLNIAHRNLSDLAAANMRAALERGDLDVHLVIATGKAGMRVSGAFVDRAGHATTFCNVFVPAAADDELDDLMSAARQPDAPLN